MLWKQLQELLDKSHNLSHGHDYDALDDEEGCATCRRENVLDRIADSAPSFLDAYDEYLAHKV